MVFIKPKALSNIILVISIILIILSSMRFLYPMRVKEMHQDFLKEHVSDVVFIGEGEYTPKWIMFPPTARPPEKFQCIKGNAEFSQYKVINPVDYRVQVLVNQMAAVCFHNFYFPGWQVFVDDKETEVYPENKYGLIVFTIPPGEHSVRVVFGSTPIRQMAVIISGVGIFLFAMMILFRKQLEGLKF